MNSLATTTHIFVGKAKQLPYLNKTVQTAIFKQLTEAPTFASSLGFTGDEQGDTKHHGGLDKAICVYLDQSYQYWKKYEQHQITYGSFSENLVLNMFKEDEVCIGDTYKIGEAIVQVSQPRQPCYKLGIRNDWKEMVVISRNSGYTGFYLRVLQEGFIAPGDKIERLQREETALSIKHINDLLYSQHAKTEQLKQALHLSSLADSCKHDLTKQLHKL